MDTILILVALTAFWFWLNLWLLPRLGVST